MLKTLGLLELSVLHQPSAAGTWLREATYGFLNLFTSWCSSNFSIVMVSVQPMWSIRSILPANLLLEILGHPLHSDQTGKRTRDRTKRCLCTCVTNCNDCSWVWLVLGSACAFSGWFLRSSFFIEILIDTKTELDYAISMGLRTLKYKSKGHQGGHSIPHHLSASRCQWSSGQGWPLVPSCQTCIPRILESQMAWAFMKRSMLVAGDILPANSLSQHKESQHSTQKPVGAIWYMLF